MKHKEDQIKAIAKAVFKDIAFEYYENIPFSIRFEENDTYLMHPQLISSWTVTCKWFDPDFLDGMDKSGFLIIDDDTGEPVVLILATGGGGNCVIAKDSKGKYYVERNY